jgi:hypothetical protein
VRDRDRVDVDLEGQPVDRQELAADDELLPLGLDRAVLDEDPARALLAQVDDDDRRLELVRARVGDVRHLVVGVDGQVVEHGPPHVVGEGHAEQDLARDPVEGRERGGHVAVVAVVDDPHPPRRVEPDAERRPELGLEGLAREGARLRRRLERARGVEDPQLRSPRGGPRGAR